MKTDAQGLEAIEIAMRIAPTAKSTAITRLVAIPMLFYRQPVGQRAQDALHSLMDDATVTALYFLLGFAQGSKGGGWERLAFPGDYA